MKRIGLLVSLVCIFAGLPLHGAQKDTTGILQASALSPAELIRGRHAGVRVSAIDGSPLGELNVHIRGINTIRGDSQPLWIVDGAVISNAVNHNLNPFFPTGGKNSVGNDLADYSGRLRIAPLGNFSWLSPYEIESIEVIKDLSAAAIYGMAGANGVIIIKTNRRQSGDLNIRVNSNVSADFADRQGDAFGHGISHNHRISLAGMSGNNSSYNVSAFFRKMDDGAVALTSSSRGGLAVNFATEANRLFHFGLNSFLSYGSGRSAAGINYPGQASTMILSRAPEAFSETLQGWLDDQDDIFVDFRTVNSVWMQVNILRGLSFRVDGGFDYQNLTRYLWYGTQTAFGKDFNGANAILNNSVFNYNMNAVLSFTKGFGKKHNFGAKAGLDVNGLQERTNDMCGSNFDIKSLRYRSISSSGSTNEIRKFDRGYGEHGLYASLDYNYGGIAGLNALIRADHSWHLAESYNFFPAANAWFDVVRLFGAKDVFVSSFRLEGGYGSAGKEVLLPYEYLSDYAAAVPAVDKGTEYYHDGLSRLISSEYNAGLHLGFLKDRYRLSVKYFSKNTSDIFRVYRKGKLVTNQWVELPEPSILQKRESKIGNSGIEAELDLAILRTGKVSWNLNAGAAYMLSRDVRLSSLDAPAGGLVPVDSDRTIPSLYGGFGTDFRWGRFCFEASFSGASGFEILNAGKYLEEGRTAIEDSDFEKGDYLRLDHAGIRYDIPLNLRRVKSLGLSLSGRNLFTFSSYGGWNPDVNCFGVTASDYGVDYGAFPVIRSVVLGLNLKF